MAKNTKGLFNNNRPGDQPADTYPFAKNGIQSDVPGSIFNEPGFLPSSAVIPYTPIGIIECDKFPIILSTDNTFSAIGYYDDTNDVYIPIANDVSLPFRFGFNSSYYITGQAQRNYKGEIIVAFTDKRVDGVYFLNCDAPVLNTREDVTFFPIAGAPDITVTQDSGGALLPGAYFVAAQYTKNDGTTTAFLTTSEISIIGGTPGQITDKVLSIRLINCDTSYDSVVLAIISRIGGVTKAVTLDAIPISQSGTAGILFTGSELTTDITLEEVLINPAVYNKVGTMGQLNDVLYLADLEKVPEVKMQPFALMVNLRWRSELLDVKNLPTEALSGTKRSFMHQEVYAFYIRYSLRTGGWSKAFIIPGPAIQSGDTDPSAFLSTGKVFQVEDTIGSFILTSTGGAGEFGRYQNATELYPDTIDFDATPYGGINYRATNVLHHRCPSLRWCKNNLFQFNDEYGRTHLDNLSVDATNIIIPPEYVDVIDGYEILYARRTLGNSTVAGQSALLYACRAQSSADTNYISTAGNWGSVVDYDGTANDKPLIPDQRLFRFHAFDLLFNKPSIAPTFLSMQLKMYRPNLAYSGDGFLEDFSITPGSRNGPLAYLIDYTSFGTAPTASLDAKWVRAISESQYVPNNLISGKWKNIQQEGCYGGVLTGDPILDTGEFSFSDFWIGREPYEPPDKAAQFEYTFLTNLMFLRSEVYPDYATQTLVRAGSRILGTTAANFSSGDTFLCDYCFHTYGWNDWANDGYGDSFGGIKVVRRIVCESASNINLRYETVGNIYSKWYPKFPLVAQDPTNYILDFDRKVDPNQFGYTKDLNTLNDLVSSAVFNPDKEDIYQFPFRIHRGGVIGRQAKTRSWRTILPLDYFEAEKDMGRIIHLEGMDDHLLIHHENALFLTQDKAKLSSVDILQVTLGSGDIFQFEPQQAVASKLGYAGTRHDLACIRTPMGYVFLDSDQGQVFIFKGQLKLINLGLNNFFRQFLRFKENNPFIGNGYTIGYDPVYKRILLTAKCIRNASGIIPPDFNASRTGYTAGDQVVSDSRIQKFLSTDPSEYGYTCPGDIIYTAPTLTPITVADTTLIGIQVDAQLVDVEGLELASFYILNSSDNDNTFRINAKTGAIYLDTDLDYIIRSSYSLTIRITSPTGNYVDTTLDITITTEGQSLISGNQVTTLFEQSVVSTVVGTVGASSPTGGTLNYSITGGNTGTTFGIGLHTGIVTILNNTLLVYSSSPQWVLEITISDGISTVIVSYTINILKVPTGPTITGGTITILDSTPTGTLIRDFSNPGDDHVTYSISSESHPGTFTLDPVTGQLTLVDNSLLMPLLLPSYTIVVQATRGLDTPSIATLTINVWYDFATVEFQPLNNSCASTTLSYANIKIYDTRLGATISIIANTGSPTFQGRTVTLVPSVSNSVLCGSTIVLYGSTTISATRAKNDCTDGRTGSLIRYSIPAGAYYSTSSQAAADALALADITANAQTYANTNGICT